MIRSILLRVLAFLVVMVPLLMVVSWFSSMWKGIVPVFASARPVSIVASPTRVWVGVSPVYGSVDSSRVVGPPSVSADFMDQVLVAYHSPAQGEGQHIYDEGVQVGIDPVFALAFFMHESSFGRAGIATVSKNPGNLRCLPGVVCRENFAWFSSWAEGFHAWYVLLRDLYIEQWHAVTVEQIIPHYAPSADNNNEAGYISAVKHAVEVWRSGNVFV